MKKYRYKNYLLVKVEGSARRSAFPVARVNHFQDTIDVYASNERVARSMIDSIALCVSRNESLEKATEKVNRVARLYQYELKD